MAFGICIPRAAAASVALSQTRARSRLACRITLWQPGQDLTPACVAIRQTGASRSLVACRVSLRQFSEIFKPAQKPTTTTNAVTVVTLFVTIVATGIGLAMFVSTQTSELKQELKQGMTELKQGMTELKQDLKADLCKAEDRWYDLAKETAGRNAVVNLLKEQETSRT